MASLCSRHHSVQKIVKVLGRRGMHARWSALRLIVRIVRPSKRIRHGQGLYRSQEVLNRTISPHQNLKIHIQIEYRESAGPVFIENPTL